MEGDPFALVEAMTIAGFATGCEQGYLYIRGEYPLAAERLAGGHRPLRATRGYLGDDILGHGVRFDIELRRGAGAYICGEETALFNSLEGRRGEPRNKPPFPTQVGLFGQPTVINNVETLVNVLAHRARTAARPSPRIGHRALDRHQALLRLAGTSPGRASTRCRSASPSAQLLELRRRRGRQRARCRRCCSAARPAPSSPRTSSTCR